MNKFVGYVLRGCVAAGLFLMPLVAFGQGSVASDLIPIYKVDVAATALLITGILLLLLEIKIVSFGLLGILGTVCLAVATGVMWQNGRDLWGVSIYYIIPLILLIFILTIWMAVLAARAYKEKVVSGSEGFLGEFAQASEALSPSGRVFFQGTYWQAESCAPVDAGEKVRITGVDNLTLYVEPVSQLRVADVPGCGRVEVNPAD